MSKAFPALLSALEIRGHTYRNRIQTAPTMFAQAVFLPEISENAFYWSVFGKRPREGKDDWKLMGVPPGTVSKTAKFESPDPGFWCRHGYAVANVDPRGVGNSEGDVSNYGLQDGRDGYDFTEWVAAQDWCSGRVDFAGNSKAPAYVTAGWCHFHLHGSIEGFRRIRSPKKWLRIHREFEWPDTYDPENLRDLKEFFDRYLKEICNGWEMTPKIRMDVMDEYDVEVPFMAFNRNKTFSEAAGYMSELTGIT